jgi:serine/threonine protein kinase
MGEVYKARDTRLDRTVAIKILPESLAADPLFRERFNREARAISQLDHPHICALHDVGDQNGTAYLVMQHLDGDTLAQRLEKGPLPLDEALRYAVEIADALDGAHSVGIVHRDLKPGNIKLTTAGAKLLDFGLAKNSAPIIAGTSSMAPTTPAGLTAQGTILGTLQYMAPEQLEGLDADARADVFAFGAVLYEMVTGARAFHGGSQASLIGAILKDAPKPMSSIQPAGSTRPRARDGHVSREAPRGSLAVDARPRPRAEMDRAEPESPSVIGDRLEATACKGCLGRRGRGAVPRGCRPGMDRVASANGDGRAFTAGNFLAGGVCV